MGKRIVSQRRGKGSMTYRAPSHRYLSKVQLPRITDQRVFGTIKDIRKCPGHDVPLILVEYEDGQSAVMIAPEGIHVDQKISINSDEPGSGDIMNLGDLHEGTLIYSIESKPGDGGKFIRSCGGFARIFSKVRDKVIIEFPSKKKKELSGKCRAIIGVAAGGGRSEKPLLKAGNNYRKKKARNKLYPITSGQSMNAVDHPFGTSRSSKKGRPTTARRHAPPGAKVGKIGARRTGKRK
jgi:large subunit ribosomal protein L2